MVLAQVEPIPVWSRKSVGTPQSSSWHPRPSMVAMVIIMREGQLGGKDIGLPLRKSVWSGVHGTDRCGVM